MSATREDNRRLYMSYRRNLTWHAALRPIAVCAAAVLVMAAGSPREEEADAARKAHDEELRELDAHVLGAVLEDLMTYAGGDSPLLNQERAPQSLWFSPAAIATDKLIEELLYEKDAERWEKLSQPQRAATRKAAAHLRDRIGTVRTFALVRPADKRIRVAENPEPSSDVPDSPDRFSRPVRAWAPGYTPDHGFAMVRLVIPWSMHHAEGTYLLARVGKQWTIALRQFVYCP